jgi:hypothetical protein
MIRQFTKFGDRLLQAIVPHTEAAARVCDRWCKKGHISCYYCYDEHVTHCRYSPSVCRV